MRTEAGKRLLNRWSGAVGRFPSLDGVLGTFDVAAIEAETRGAERARIRVGVNDLWNGLETWGPDEFWVDGEPYVRAAAVQRLIDGEPDEPVAEGVCDECGLSYEMAPGPILGDCHGCGYPLRSKPVP